MARILGRTKAHREHTLRNLGCSFVLSGHVITTTPKAKEVKRIVEQWITSAIKLNTQDAATRLSSHRRLLRATGSQEVVRKLVSELAPRSKDRKGGYTRLHHVGFRVGDAAPTARLSFVDTAETSKKPKAEAAKDEKAPAKATA